MISRKGNIFWWGKIRWRWERKIIIEEGIYIPSEENKTGKENEE